MSAPTDVNGKAPDQPSGSQPPAGLVNVQPARLSDLQPKYAQQINHEGDDSAAHGWYASFSKCPLIWISRIHLTLRLLVHGLGECVGFLGAIPCCVCCPNPFKPVAQGEVGLISKFGRFVTPYFSRIIHTH